MMARLMTLCACGSDLPPRPTYYGHECDDCQPVRVKIVQHGSLVFISGENSQGVDWLRDNLDPEGQRWGDAHVVEPRFVNDIVDGVRAFGGEVV